MNQCPNLTSVLPTCAAKRPTKYHAIQADPSLPPSSGRGGFYPNFYTGSPSQRPRSVTAGASNPLALANQSSGEARCGSGLAKSTEHANTRVRSTRPFGCLRPNSKTSNARFLVVNFSRSTSNIWGRPSSNTPRLRLQYLMLRKSPGRYLDLWHELAGNSARARLTK